MRMDRTRPRTTALAARASLAGLATLMAVAVLAALAMLAALATIATLPTIGCATRGFEAGCSRKAGSRTREPLMWRARHPEHGGALYLLGSVHFDESGARPLGAEIERAFALSDELVVEVDLDSAANLAAADALGRRGLLEPPQTLADVVSRATFERLAQYLDERGLAVERIASRKPWYVANLLVVTELQRAGYDAAHGVDRRFIERARDKPIVELESAGAQLELLDGLPLETQEAMLRDALERSPDFERATRELLDAWRYGDEQTLQQIVLRSVADEADFEPFLERVFFRRNAAMSEQLASLARDGRTRFAVLGAGHMLGPRGIPALLCERGFEVLRVSGGARASGADSTARRR
jgi:hypothetical protein